LASAGTLYLLLGATAGLGEGDRVEVVGTVQPDAVTTCQQGTPLRVESVVRR